MEICPIFLKTDGLLSIVQQFTKKRYLGYSNDRNMEVIMYEML